MRRPDTAALCLFPVRRDGWSLSWYECPDCLDPIRGIVTDDDGVSIAYPCRHRLPTDFPD
ncbi:hypothetical protein [Halalkalicoccus sp. NIPERK01]|uniref:hypothetical protein n=1 Tax=Halalkalicoccus sp. NIPERK01 TaxID=3053469 RepID=UPI00256F61B4|nr:hypothetical protein [Halalkalicoccus sp. NIPERK01]MDL5361028.1 hypothetical protein [Halalkalicoccus sp. NIPERK01]